MRSGKRGTPTLLRFWHSSRHVLAASVTLLLLTAPQASGLRWRAPEGCPSQADAAAYLQTELHSDPAQGSSDVQAEATQTGWQAEVRIDGDEPRTLAAASCEDLMAAAMVIIAVARDAQPEAEPEPPEPVVPIVPEPASPPVSDPAPEVEAASAEPFVARPPEDPATPRIPLSHWVGVDAGIAAIHVPAVAARLGARYVLRGERWAVRVGGHYETPRRLLYPGADVGGRFSAVAADVLACYEPGRGSLTATMCAGPAAGGVLGPARASRRHAARERDGSVLTPSPGCAGRGVHSGVCRSTRCSRSD